MKFVPYLGCVDSGVEWLGELPASWSVESLKRRFRVANGSTPKSDEPSFWDGDIPWVTPEDLSKVTGKVIESTRRQITAEGYESCATRRVPQGSVILSTRAPIGSLAISAVELCTNQGCRALVPSAGALPEFIYYFLSSAVDPLQSFGRGTTFLELSAADLASFPAPFPSVQEQQAIVTFLDREIAKLDTLIAKQNRLIELLQEKRQAIISHAVTKGLNPDAPMKDSGLEWLGEVPEHWTLTRARRVAGVFVPQRNKPELNEIDGVFWATMEDMGGDTIASTSYRVSDAAMKSAGSRVLPTDSVITSCVGNFGAAVINRVPVVINQQLQAFVPRRITAVFLRYLVAASRPYFEMVATAATLVYVNQERFADLPLVVPPSAEQVAIVRRLDEECQKIDGLVAKARRSIELIQEHRTALISSAVTGKIDLRAYADASSPSVEALATT